MKKGFTLVEILVSIALFSIIVLFLYQTLQLSQQSGEFYSSKLKEFEKINFTKQILFTDIVNRTDSNTTLTQDDQIGSIVQFKTNNTYHNPFFNYVTYMVSKKQNLLRLESKTYFKLRDAQYEFYDHLYVDTLLNDVEKFKVVLDKDKKIAFYIKQKNKDAIFIKY
ncbi:MAG: prepilin-type N-terminal cleavage/methylation domain-containing protein [Campylobacterales bacterium]|nr:prepilin-type N-terminal cleavage/methylation domain-containing protein [Campylobacterales bacterium]